MALQGIPSLDGRHCVVVGSAPLASPIRVEATDYVVGVNGGISSCPIADGWVLNARSATDAATIGSKRNLHALMLEQGRGRCVSDLLLLVKGDGARVHTMKRLVALGVRTNLVIDIENETRREIEQLAGARDSSMTRQALSAGLFAAAWCFWQGAETVRLEGFSWRGGYAYMTETIPVRGHEAGDKQALRRLAARYPERLRHSLN